jgi:hypothetical protein
MKDLVYIVGTGSKWQDNELRFSLRSVAKNLTGYGKVWIIGDCPCFVQGVEHRYYPDNDLSGNNNDANMIDKILFACEQGISEDFVFMNDDFFILKPMHVDEIPVMHKGDMTEKPKEYWRINGIWQQRLLNTFNKLKARGMSTMLYDMHCPMPMNKTLFPEVIKNWDYKVEPGLNFRSIYGNTVYMGEGLRNNGHKFTVFTRKRYEVIAKEAEKGMFMAVNDAGLWIVTKSFIRSEFPEQSDFEKTAPDTITIGSKCNEKL